MFYETKLTLGIFPLKLYIPIQIHNLETWFNPQTFFFFKNLKTTIAKTPYLFFILLKVRFCQIPQASLKLAMLQHTPKPGNLDSFLTPKTSFPMPSKCLKYFGYTWMCLTIRSAWHFSDPKIACTQSKENSILTNPKQCLELPLTNADLRKSSVSWKYLSCKLSLYNRCIFSTLHYVFKNMRTSVGGGNMSYWCAYPPCRLNRNGFTAVLLWPFPLHWVVFLLSTSLGSSDLICKY